MSDGPQHLAGLAWSVSDLLRGDFKTSEYGKIILPFTVLRRLECVLAPTKQDVLDAAAGVAAQGTDVSQLLLHVSGHAFFNASELTLKQIAVQSVGGADSLCRYVEAFSENVREVMERYDFAVHIRRLERVGLLQRVVGKFADLDLRPETVANHQMGYVVEDFVRRFAEQSNETAGEHFTPRDVVRLMANLLVAPDAEVLRLPGVIRTILDPVCGTGGMLREAEERIVGLNTDARVSVFGQELNSESWAICRSEMMMRGNDPGSIKFGNIFSDDGHSGACFDYLLANPPFGVSWKNVSNFVEDEYRMLGNAGRFGAGLPRINDSSLLFLQHMLSKMRPVDASGVGGSRIAIVFNGSPMYAGSVASGESNIRQWIIENDWLEAVIALPDKIFYNTSIPTCLWILTNRKQADRKGKVVLLDARDHWQQMRRPLGAKRKYVTSDQIGEITQLYGDALLVTGNTDHPLHGQVRVLRNEEFGYQQITVNYPLRLRFEISEETLARLADSKPVQKTANPKRLVAALRSLLGSVWTDKTRAFAALKSAVTASGHAWPAGVSFQKAVRDAFGIRDPRGEIQQYRGVPEPDSELRSVVNLPLSRDPEEFLSREVLPKAPEAWIDHARTKTGYEIPLTLFFRTRLNTRFAPLRQFAYMETARVDPVSGDADGEGKPSYLRMQDLRSVDSAVELPDAPDSGPSLTHCAGGDLVGRAGNWRLLPQGFGEAVTSLYVLHPYGNSGRALCEWLNSRSNHDQFPTGRDLMNLPVPADLVLDEQFGDLLDDVHVGRRVLREATSGLLPNVFTDAKPDIRGLREDIRSAASEARLIGELVRPLVDPVWRAEWSYPYHVAALARRYRISTQPAEKMDALLKLGEGIARTLGILALTELVAKEGFTKKLRQQFRNGASFGTWLTLISKLVDEVEVAGTQEFSNIRDHGDLYSLLEGIKDVRNDSHHAHGVRASHELNDEVDQLEPRVVSALIAANWLSGTHWDWVERCEYRDESSYRLVGQRLRGSHPSWEPFERSSTHPLRPERIYVGSTTSGAPIDLWPLASVSVCTSCNVHELFLINEVRDGVITLRSLDEHSADITYTSSE